MHWLLTSLVFVLSILLTWMISKLAWNVGLLDEPDHRRSHVMVTPRGGGLAIALVFWLWIFLTLAFFDLDRALWLPLCPTLMIAAVGFMDDLFSLSASYRLMAQFFTSIFSMFLMGGIQFVLNINGVIIPSVVVWVVSLLFLVWSINLYNFMDGINGLAGFEALMVSGVMAYITYIDGDISQSSMWTMLAAAVAGFLIWNFPKAKIFLGDVGSYFLGSTFGILLLESANSKPRWFWCGMILLGYFVVDATVTLLVRIWYKQPVYMAHKTHAFQIFLTKFKSNHTVVTSLVISINLFWLTPWAIIVSKGYIHGFFAMLVAYLPLIMIVWRVEAGKPTSNPL
jgi:Fuc2NAc and GlcNAc transferase